MERWWWVSLCVCMFMYSEWVRVWVSDASVVCVSEGCESEWSEWSEVKSISYCKYAEHAGICKKTCSWSAKKYMINKKCQSLQKKCNISTVIGDQDFIYRLKIYIEFRSLGGIFCGGILTLQETRFSGPGTTGRPLGGLDTLDQPKPTKRRCCQKTRFLERKPGWCRFWTTVFTGFYGYGLFL